ncbi:hypothetical protein V5O48_007591 [Marasmius crinis-equi]|uniref:Metallo-beta-lactamase domain-containing protein n=1 Tax=Marasmius crinis-equi TaxID=585013 RepID=A0ABR3FG73_9AGAR
MSVHLHHLTGDNSWLLTFSDGLSSSRDTYNSLTFLLDPWFSEPDVQGHKFWLQQLHSPAKPPQFQDFKSLKDFLAAEKRQVDGVIISFAYSDHLHKPTIDGVDEDIPFFAFNRAAKTLQQWGRKYVYEISKEPGLLGVYEGIIEAEARAGRGTSRKELIEKLDVQLSFLPTTAWIWDDFAQDLLHGCLVITFFKSGGRGAIIYSPHGTPLKDLKRWKTIQDTKENPDGIEVVAFMAGWDVINMPRIFGGLINFGVPKNAQIAELLTPRYWIRTHDEMTTMSGFVSSVLKREVWTKEKVECELRTDERRTKIIEMDPGETLTIAATATESIQT